MTPDQLKATSLRSPRPGIRTVTVRDVAKAAGVSVATVSRVLNGKSSVADELRARVEHASALLSHGVVGMMLVGARHSDDVYQLLATKGAPFVNTWVHDDTHPSVGSDNYAIDQVLANYLLDLGHRDFGVIAQQSPQSDSAAKRVAGIRAALAGRANN